MQGQHSNAVVTELVGHCSWPSSSSTLMNLLSFFSPGISPKLRTLCFYKACPIPWSFLPPIAVPLVLSFVWEGASRLHEAVLRSLLLSVPFLAQQKLFVFRTVEQALYLICCSSQEESRFGHVRYWFSWPLHRWRMDGTVRGTDPEKGNWGTLM